MNYRLPEQYVPFAAGLRKVRIGNRHLLSREL